MEKELNRVDILDAISSIQPSDLPTDTAWHKLLSIYNVQFISVKFPKNDKPSIQNKQLYR